MYYQFSDLPRSWAFDDCNPTNGCALQRDHCKTTDANWHWRNSSCPLIEGDVVHRARGVKRRGPSATHVYVGFVVEHGHTEPQTWRRHRHQWGDHICHYIIAEKLCVCTVSTLIISKCSYRVKHVQLYQALVTGVTSNRNAGRPTNGPTFTAGKICDLSLYHSRTA